METLYNKKASTQEWVLRVEGKEDIPLIGMTYLGRDIDADICIPDDRISRKHARISITPNNVTLEDLGSCNGTSVNGRPISGVVRLNSGDTIKLHMIEFSILDMAVSQKDLLVLKGAEEEGLALKGKLTVGRDPSCDLCIDDPRISREHARISASASGVVLGDLNSINGTYVNGRKLDQPTVLKAGDKVSFHDRAFTIVPAFDPDATRICRPGEDVEATRFDRLFVAGTALESSKEKDEAIIVSSKMRDEELDPSVYIEKDISRPSAIEKQQRNQGSSSEQQLSSLKLGMWVEIAGNLGKRKAYCLVSTGEPKNAVYSFAKQSGWGLLKKSRAEVLKGLREGSMKIIRDNPTTDKSPVFFAGRLKQFL